MGFWGAKHGLRKDILFKTKFGLIWGEKNGGEQEEEGKKRKRKRREEKKK